MMFVVYLDKVALVYLYKTCSNWHVDTLNTGYTAKVEYAFKVSEVRIFTENNIRRV